MTWQTVRRKRTQKGPLATRNPRAWALTRRAVTCCGCAAAAPGSDFGGFDYSHMQLKADHANRRAAARQHA